MNSLSVMAKVQLYEKQDELHGQIYGMVRKGLSTTIIKKAFGL